MKLLISVKLYEKCFSTVNNCKTLSQLNNSKKYLELFFKKYNDKEAYDKILERYHILELEYKRKKLLEIFPQNNKRQILYF